MIKALSAYLGAQGWPMWFRGSPWPHCFFSLMSRQVIVDVGSLLPIII